MMYTEQALRLRPVIEQAAQSLDDNTALASAELFPRWEKLVSAGKTAERGFRFRYGGGLYRTEQPGYTFVSHYVPGSAGTESLFSRVDEAHAGTFEDPIPYTGNMEIWQDCYYRESGVIYLCIRSSEQPLHHSLSDLAGIYVEAVV